LAYVRIDSEEPLEKAIKRFRRKVEKEGIIREYRRREYFTKPSTLKHEKEKARQRKELKKKLKNQRRNPY
jgi:small subunit ribosomal protein S21